jgi:hypothetical protein
MALTKKKPLWNGNPQVLKKKKCKVCKEAYQPYRPLQEVCSGRCGLNLAIQRREKNERKAHMEAKQKLKTKSDHLKEAQHVFNKFIRLRDHSLACISCGRHHTGQNHAGHYRSVGAAPELRFHEDNVHLQCAPCNNHKSGNAIEYRISLIKKIGLARVEWLEGKHEPKKYTIDQIKEIKAEYRRKCKELEPKASYV